MGNVQSHLQNNPKAAVFSTFLLIIGGICYYQSHNKTKIHDIDANATTDIPKQFDTPNPSKPIDVNKSQCYFRASESANKNAEKQIMEDDDRRRSVDTATDKRTIIQCIGSISAYNKKDVTKDWYGRLRLKRCFNSTGTVFKVIHSELDNTNYFFVITCAHAIHDKQLKSYDYIFFERIDSFGNGKWTLRQDYRMVGLRLLKDDNGKFLFQGENDENDLAVLMFKDRGNYYTDLFNYKHAIQLVSADNLRSNRDKDAIDLFSIYGFPCEDGKRKGLRGMEGKSKVDKNDKENPMEVDMYFHKRNKGKLFFYNSVDTEGGQSGSAIFSELENDKFSIVGIHVGNREFDNVGAALNDDNIEKLKPKDEWFKVKKRTKQSRIAKV